MKKELYPLCLLFIMTITAGLSVSAQTKETRNVKGFTKVNFGVAGDLFIEFGPEFNLTIEGSKKAVDEVLTVVSGDRLNIRRETYRFNFRGDDEVIIHLTMPEIEAVGISGSGRVRVTDPVEADNLDLGVSGSGRLMATARSVDNFSCSISGSGSVVLESTGSIDDGEITISGSGNYIGEETEIDHLEVSISGSGNCRCKAGDTLEARVSGSGNVTSGGNPRVDARVSGSGHVRSR